MADASSGFRERLLNALRAASNGTTKDRENLLDQVAYGVEHITEFEEDTRLLIEKVGALLMRQVTEGLEAIPASPEQRTLKRGLDLSAGRHYRPRGLLESLERPPAQLPDFAIQGEAVCLSGLQEVADLAYDTNKITRSGNDGLAFQGLVSECVQEAIFALHAARHGFRGQALANCRAIYEDVDLLALFRKDPSARDLWLFGDSKRIRKELAPIRVREKLGRLGEDVPYKFLSEMGTHTSVHSVLMRSRSVEGGTPQRPRVLMQIGGSHDRDLLLPVYTSLTMQIHHLLLETIGWSQHLQAGFHENWERLHRTTALRRAFMNGHALPWMRERGFPDEVIKTLSSMNDLPGR